MPLSLHEQLKMFSEAADGLRDDITEEELAELAKDIENNASALWSYYNVITEDADRLRARAEQYAEAARQQRNKAARVKDALKYALKVSGFTRAKFGDMKMVLSETRKPKPKRPATEADFYNAPELCHVKFNWAGIPTFEDWTSYPSLVEPHFEFDVKALKEAGREDLLDYDVTERLTVTIAKE
jgi:hypothetical protein